MAMLARARREYNVDPARLLLTGLSQGGHGAWVLGARHPELWAALVPVCGYARVQARADAGCVSRYRRRARAPPRRASRCGRSTARRTTSCPVAETRAMVAALAGAPGRSRASTFYPGVGHGCWERAYGEQELPGWLLARRRPAP